MKDEPTILIVDDNEDLAETFAMILKRRGFSVETAGNGTSAVDKFKEQTYDVTLMDIVMPEMNGVEAFKKIKELQPGAPVILMTAYSDEELIQTARDEGVHQIIHKPIHVENLIKLITEAASSQPILVIDDDADICETLTQVLKLQGHQVLTAGSGEEALEIAKQHDCQMAFIDVKLPNIDGLETLLRLKEVNPELLTVMMTGFRNEVKDALDKAQASSAVTCLYKPFDPAEAAEIVKKIGKKPRHSGSENENK
ncbi:MAG TPA: response regulator [Dehalococcoidales bacterium]|nr:response regulator [Dehalococcoidales bacterium]